LPYLVLGFYFVRQELPSLGELAVFMAGLLVVIATMTASPRLFPPAESLH